MLSDSVSVDGNGLVMTADSVVALTLDLCASHPSALAALEGPDPLRARLSLYARACGASDSSSLFSSSPSAWIVLNEAGSTGECVLKAAHTPARAHAAQLVAAAAPNGVFARVLASGDGGRVVLYERLGAPLASLRAELAAGGALFPLLARALADALAPSAFAASVWAQAPPPASLALRASFAPGGPLADAGVTRAAAAARLVLLADAILSLGQRAADMLPTLAERASSDESIAHGELSTSRVLVGLVPVGPARLADPESFRPDEYPGAGAGAVAVANENAEKNKSGAVEGGVGSDSGSGGGWASTPAYAVSGELRLTGGGGARPAPLGADLGSLLGGLAAAALAARARGFAAGAVAAKGGYAAFSSRATASRWEGHAVDIGAAAEDIWTRWSTAFRGAWDADATAGHAAVLRRADGAAPPGTDAAVAAHWNTHAPVAMGGTQDAFLAGVAGDALGFAGVALARDAAAPDASPNFGSLPPAARAHAAAAARLTAALLIGVGSTWPKTSTPGALLPIAFAFFAAALEAAATSAAVPEAGVDFDCDLAAADAALSPLLAERIAFATAAISNAAAAAARKAPTAEKHEHVGQGCCGSGEKSPVTRRMSVRFEE